MRARSPPVYLRDFAYANSTTEVMREDRPRADINAATSARSFADLNGMGVVHEAEKLRARLLSGPTVDLYVGQERRHWALHLNLLCHHSAYFETEFKGHEVPRRRRSRDAGQSETGPMKLELLEDDPRGFELLVKWLYQGQLEDMTELSEEGKYDYAVACYNLYGLCEKFDMMALKNVAMNTYRQALHEAELVPDADEINEIYRASTPGSAFRKLMTKIAARQIMDPGVDKDAESYRHCFEGNPDFAVDMVNAIRSMSGGMLFEDPTMEHGCEYHDHSDGSECQVVVKRQTEQPPRIPKQPVARIQEEKLREEPQLTPPPPPQPEAAPPASPVFPKALPVELSAERKTPRKLRINSTPPSPSPKSTHPRSSQPNKPHSNGLPLSPKHLSNGTLTHNSDKSTHRLSVASSTTSSQPSSSRASHTSSSSSTSYDHPARGSVLGKRRSAPLSPASSSTSGRKPQKLTTTRPVLPTRKSTNVEGIVRQYNGISRPSSSSGGDSRRTSDGSGKGKRKGAPKLELRAIQVA